MQERARSDTRFTHNLAAIRRGAERLRDLVDQMLAFGRRRDARRKPLSVTALIAETTSLLGVSLPRASTSSSASLRLRPSYPATMLRCSR
jgi:signal transduction histidine kinase